MKKIFFAFSFFMLIAHVSYGQVTGTVYDDLNANGTQDGGEPGIAGVDVIVTDFAPSTQTVVTDGSGNWTAIVVDGLGSIDVDDSDPQLAGYYHTGGVDPSPFFAFGGVGVGGSDGYFSGGVVTGHVYQDNTYTFSQNITHDIDLAGVDVSVTGAITDPVTTDASGNWTAFILTANVGAGTALIDVLTLPSNWEQTEGDNGTSITSVASAVIDGGTDGYFLTCTPRTNDPQLSGLTVLEDSVRVALTANLQVGWTMSGGDLMGSAPAGSFGITVVFPINYSLTAGDVSNITGGTEFNWTYNAGTRTLTGISNQPVDVGFLASFSGRPSDGTINILITGEIASGGAIPQSSANIFVITDVNGGCEQAFTNNAANDNSTGGIEVVSSILPIELVYFEGHKIGERVRLDWKTEVEINNDFFEVQRSTDGQTFEVIGIVDGSGTTSVPQVYQYWDESLPTTEFIYYRLRQVDYDLSYVYTNVVVIRNTKIGSDVTFTLFPNPASDYVELEFDGSSMEKASITLYTTDGKLLFQQDAASEFKSSSRVTLDISDYAMGIYFVELIVDGKIMIKKLNIAQ